MNHLQSIIDKVFLSKIIHFKFLSDAYYNIVPNYYHVRTYELSNYNYYSTSTIYRNISILYNDMFS